VKAPQRGEVWLVDLGLAAKVRPAVVMSIPATDVDRALVTIVPNTTRPRLPIRGSHFGPVPAIRGFRRAESRAVPHRRGARIFSWQTRSGARG
jgi:mRNA interferase MazF